MEWARMAASGNRRLVSTDDVTAVHPRGIIKIKSKSFSDDHISHLIATQ